MTASFKKILNTDKVLKNPLLFMIQRESTKKTFSNSEKTTSVQLFVLQQLNMCIYHSYHLSNMTFIYEQMIFTISL